MLSPAGPVVIDWIDMSLFGSPLADVARTSILTQGIIEVEPQFSRFRRFGLRLMQIVYLRHYSQPRPGGYDEYQCWLPIVAAARFNENVLGWDGFLLAQAGKLL